MKPKLGKELIKGMNEAVSYMQGKKVPVKVHKVVIPEDIDVRAIREKLHLSREKFAAQFGMSPRTLQHWEQGSRKPHGPAKVLLVLLQKAPTMVSKILKQ